jgi:hypothetical protein
MNYYTSINGIEKGPYTLAQIEAMWRGGHITADTFLCDAGKQLWTSVAELKFTVAADELAKRVQRLERKNQVLVWVLILAGIIALLARHGNPATAPGTAPELALRDAAGNVRWKVAVAGDGTVSQSFFDANGRERLYLGLDNENSTRLRMFDLDGNKRVSLFALATRGDDLSNKAGLSVLPPPKADGSQNGGVEIISNKDRSAKLSVNSSDTSESSSMFASADGSTGTSFTDNAGRIPMATFISKENDAWECFYDTSANLRSFTASFANGSSRLSLLDNTGRERLVSITMADGTTRQMVNDGQGKPQFSFLVDARGEAHHYLAQSTGEQVWDDANKVTEGIEMISTGAHVLSYLFGKDGKQ